MTKVYIAQMKCPNNHCVVALAGEYKSPSDALDLAYILGTQFAAGVKSGIFWRECGICKATDLQVQVSPTRFRTMQEAEPFLRQSAAQQAQSAAMLKSSRN